MGFYFRILSIVSQDFLISSLKNFIKNFVLIYRVIGVIVFYYQVFNYKKTYVSYNPCWGR